MSADHILNDGPDPDDPNKHLRKAITGLIIWFIVVVLILGSIIGYINS